MTVVEAYKEIKDYFNLDLAPFSQDKLMRILLSLQKTKTVVKYKKVYINDSETKEYDNTILDLVHEAEKIAEIYNTTLTEMQSKCGQSNIVSARAHLCRYVRMNSTISLKQMGRFLKKDHTTIIHYIYRSKTECLIPVLKSKYKIK